MSTLDFTYLKYPNEAVKTLSDNDISLKTFKNRATDGDGEYDEARGHDDANGVIVSPYYTLKINGNYIPVYSTVVFVGDTETGELHSYSEIYIKDNTNLPLNIELISEDFKIKDAVCLPKSLNITTDVDSGTMTSSINGTGTYTFLFNDANQEATFTLFVKDYIDEDATINNLKAAYGEDVENFHINNIKYKNIKYNSELPAKFTSNGKQNTINATIENVTANGSTLTNSGIEKDNFANVTVN